MMKRTFFAGLLLAAATTGTQADSTSTAMYFHSHVRDAPECTATVADGTITYPAAINSPAATCADAFAWASFLETIQAKFWDQWANDETVWVVDPERPDIKDPAWKSYRLKGTQTQFTNFDGYPTILGSSINEGGFVNSASCISCHVQASVNADGGIGAPGVGASGRLNNFGIGS